MDRIIPSLDLTSSYNVVLPEIDLNPYSDEDLHAFRRALYAPIWEGFWENPNLTGCGGYMCVLLSKVLGSKGRQEQGIDRVLEKALWQTSGFWSVGGLVGFYDQMNPLAMAVRKLWHKHTRDHLDAILSDQEV